MSISFTGTCRAIVVFAFGVVVIGCGSESTGGECNFTSTFDAIQERVFDAKRCSSAACHGKADEPAGGLDLRAGFAYESLVRVQGRAAPIDRVFPGDQDRSLLYFKLAAKTQNVGFDELLSDTALAEMTVTGDPMPQGGLPAITSDELSVIAEWIRAGAGREGIVAGTEKALGCEGVLVADPNKIEPLTPPAADVGVQLYSGAWQLPAESEDEVCYVTYYDFSDQIPGDALTACPEEWGDGRVCFSFGRNELAQDPQSHHSIITVYTPPSNPTSDEWGDWVCVGGDTDGQVCDPTVAGVCGERSQCGTRVETSFACIDYEHAPTDLSTFDIGAASAMGSTRENVGGSQEATSVDEPLDGVYAVLPVQGFAVWNSHAFNLTPKDTTIEQWVNFEFVKGDEPPNGRVWRRVQIFEADQIFGMGRIDAFQSKEVCRTFGVPQYARLMTLTSHMHQRGVLFRVWGPPQDACGGGFIASDPNCVPPAAGESDPAFMYLNRVYNDAVINNYDPPLRYDSDDLRDRTFKACAVFDNGADDPSTVKRHSTRPNASTCAIPLAGALGIAGCGCPPEERACVGGPSQGVLCNGDDSVCGDGGVCDACPLAGGITTDDEMFIPLGSYFVQTP